MVDIVITLQVLDRGHIRIDSRGPITILALQVFGQVQMNQKREKNVNLIVR